MFIPLIIQLLQKFPQKLCKNASIGTDTNTNKYRNTNTQIHASPCYPLSISGVSVICHLSSCAVPKLHFQGKKVKILLPENSHPKIHNFSLTEDTKLEEPVLRIEDHKSCSGVYKNLA